MVVFCSSPLQLRRVSPACEATLTKRTEDAGAPDDCGGAATAGATRPARSAPIANVNGPRSVGRGDAFGLALTEPLEQFGVQREFPLRLPLLPGLLQRLTQGVVRLRIDRIELERPAEQRDGLLVPAPGREDRSDVVVGVRIGGRQAAGLFELGQGLVVASQAAVRPGQLEVRLGVSRDDLDGALEGREGLLEPQS